MTDRAVLASVFAVGGSTGACGCHLTSGPDLRESPACGSGDVCAWYCQGMSNQMSDGVTCTDPSANDRVIQPIGNDKYNVRDGDLNVLDCADGVDRKQAEEIAYLTRKIRGVFRFRYRHKSPHVVQVQF